MADDGEWVKSDERVVVGGGARPTIPLFTLVRKLTNVFTDTFGNNDSRCPLPRTRVRMTVMQQLNSGRLLMYGSSQIYR